MDLKNKIDIIDKKANIVNKKLIAYLAIAGGTWLYGINIEKSLFVSLVASIFFGLAVAGTVFSILKLNKLFNELKDL